MTVTNDERREVARELRELPIDMYEVLKSWGFEGIDTCCSDQTDYYLIHQAVFGCVPADHMHPCDYEELHARLADLIEPEKRTCHDVSFDSHELVCSWCGCHIDVLDIESEPTMWLGGSPIEPSFCPNCGAKVVEE